MKAEHRRRLLEVASGQRRSVTGVTGVTEDVATRTVTLVTPVTPAQQPAALQLGNGWSLDDWQALFEERAAIREFDGGLSRDEAERLAVEDMLTRYFGLNPAAKGSK